MHIFDFCVIENLNNDPIYRKGWRIGINCAYSGPSVDCKMPWTNFSNRRDRAVPCRSTCSKRSANEELSRKLVVENRRILHIMIQCDTEHRGAISEKSKLYKPLEIVISVGLSRNQGSAWFLCPALFETGFRPLFRVPGVWAKRLCYILESMNNYMK